MQDACTNPTTPITDRECLEAWRRDQSPKNLLPLIERYGALVYASAYRQTGRDDHAEEVMRAVFLVLTRRARKLRKNTVLAGWLFHITALASRKFNVKRGWTGWRRWFGLTSQGKSSSEMTLWTRVAPEIDGAIERLPASHRDAVLLSVMLNRDSKSVARTLRTTERRGGQGSERGLKKITRLLRKRGVPTDIEVLAKVCSSEGCSIPPPEGLVAGILESIEATKRKRPALKLARSVLKSLAWERWRRRFLIDFPVVCLLLAIIGGIAWQIDSRSGHSRLIAAFVVWSVRFGNKWMSEPAGRWPTNTAAPQLDARIVRNARDLYKTTNIWLAQLNFTSEQWKALAPKWIDPLPNFVQPDGLWLLRNPNARRNGLAGVLGYEFDWTHAGFEFGSAIFTNVALRVKGNAGSLPGPKHPFKIDLNRFAKGQKLGGLDELTFNNLCWDYSCLRDALGYEFFRDAGVPAPRTAYAWLSATVAKQWDRKPLGLYLMVEPVDKMFAAERFASRQTPVFKPVTYNLFEDLGDDWSAYAGIYDLKTKATADQQRRVIELARLVSSATDEEFAAHIGDFLDLDEFARFLASEVLISNYDSILTTGQNFYMYLDARSNKFGFIPWDLDAAWGNFWIGTKQELEHASIWHPWVGKNRFLERTMGVEQFRQIYRAHLEDFLTRLFLPHRLQGRIDEMAAILHAPIAAESAFRLNKFEQELSMKPVRPSPGESLNGFNRPAYPLNRFVEARARSVRQQLDGKSAGMILKPPTQK